MGEASLAPCVKSRGSQQSSDEKVLPTKQDQVLPTPVKVDRLWDLLEGYDEGGFC